MATIFQKTATDNCLILGARESLTYPFSLGNWTEVRMGFYISVTSSSGDNTLYGGNETIPFASGPANIYVGLTSSEPGFPRQNGKTYIGLGPHNPGSTQNLNSTVISCADASNTRLAAVDASGNLSISTAGAGMIGYTNTTGNTNYARFYGLRYVVSSNNQYTVTKTAGASPVTNPTVEDTRAQLQAMPSSDSLGSLYFNYGFTSSGVQLPRPNNVYLYFPFWGSRVRIHALVVDKYA